MHIHDPRVLALVLEDLLDRLQKWSILASDLSSSACQLQKSLEESLERSSFRLRLAIFQWEQDQERIADSKTEIVELAGRLQQACDSANQSFTITQKLVGQAEAGLAHWKRELEDAEVWLDEAQAWVRRATIELEEARIYESAAKSALDSARRSLRSCESSDHVDSEGRRHRPDCSGEAAAVNRAADRLREAIAAVALAEAELQRALEEERKAQSRVQCCSEAVRASVLAVDLAGESLAQATSAVEAAERSQEHNKAAELFAAQASRVAEEEASAVEESESAVAAGSTATSEAALHSRRAEEAEESAQRLVALARTALEKMISDLLSHARTDARLEAIQG